MHGAAPPHRYIYIRGLLVKMRRDVSYHGRFLLPRHGDNENTPSFEGVAENFDTILFLQSEACYCHPHHVWAAVDNVLPSGEDFFIYITNMDRL